MKSVMHVLRTSHYRPGLSSFDLHRFSLALLSLCLMATFALSGCGVLTQKQVLPPTTTTVSPPPQKINPLREIEGHFAKNEYTKVEILGKQLLDDPSLSTDAKARVAQLYAVAAMRSDHAHIALSALDAWRTHSPQADTRRDWQEVWCNTIALLPSMEARTKANELYQDSSRAPVVRGVAATAFAVRQWEDGDLGETMAALEYVYNSAADSTTRAAYEGRLSSLLTRASHSAIGLIADSVNDENYTRYPYNIIFIDQLHRQLDNPQTRPQAQSALAELQNTAALVDKSLIKGPPVPVQFTGNLMTSVPPSGGSFGKTVVLALPRSGQLALVVDKIIDGAQSAANEAGATVMVVDTDQAGWIEQIRTLDNNVIIGGLIRRGDYTALKNSKQTSEKVTFAFQSSLDGADEGLVAWRFFSSPGDQIKTLVDFTSSLGAKNYLSLYPDETYGRRMNQLFEIEVSKAGGNLTSGSYNPQQPDGWSSVISNYFGPKHPPYHAIFMPDTLKNVDALLPGIRYYNQGSQIILGTSLWEQALVSTTVLPNPANYAYAVFPGSWNGATPAADGARLQTAMRQQGKNADSWTGLGYDFTRFAIAFPVQPGWTPSAINTALNQFSMGWSMAPLYWDSNGKVRQQLFLFTPHETFGYAPIDKEVYKKLLR